MEQTKQFKKYDFDKAIKSGYSKSEIIKSLRNDYETTLDWEAMNESLKSYSKKDRDDILFNSLYQNQDSWGVLGTIEKQPPKPLQNRILSQKQTQDIDKQAQDLPQWAIQSALTPQILRESVGVDNVWKMFQSKEDIARENALKSEFDKGIKQKLENGKNLNMAEILRYYNTNEVNKGGFGIFNYLPQIANTTIKANYEKQKELKEIANTDFKDLSAQQKEELQRQNKILRLWKKDKELHENLKDEVSKQELDEHTKQRARQLEKDIINIQRTYQNLLKAGTDFLSDSTEQRDKYIQQLQESAISLGFDGIGFKEDRIYAFKDEKAIFIDDGFFENLAQIIGTNAFDIAGSITGAIAGFKKAPNNKYAKIAGTFGGGAVGAGLGGIADSIIAQHNSRGEFNLADALLTGAESAAFDIAGGIVVAGGAKAIRGTATGVKKGFKSRSTSDCFYI